jgi:uroporphyrinogen III methyltransferase/synthase
MVPGADGRTGPGRPLEGRTVVVTRAVEQAPALIEPLRALGADVIAMAVIEIEPPLSWADADAAIDALDGYDWIVLTSANAVDSLHERMHLHGLRIQDLAGRPVAVIGPATAERLREFGVEPTVAPSRSRAEGLVESLRAASPNGGRVLIARAEEAREVLPDDLRALGFTVDVVPVYRIATAAPPLEAFDRFVAGDVDAVLFASGGTARRFSELVTRAGMDPTALLMAPLVVSIGPVTTDVLHGLGIAVDVQAQDTTAAALVEAVVARLGSVAG